MHHLRRSSVALVGSVMLTASCSPAAAPSTGPTSRRGCPGKSPFRTALLGALAIVLLAGCVSPATQSHTSNGPPVATASMSFVEPSEEVEPSEQAPGLSGTWDGTWVIDGYGTSGDFTMELVQSGDSFTGTVEITNTDCSNGFVDGTLDGSTVDFGWLLTPQPVQFTGTLIGSSMSGTWEAIACSNPNLSLTGTWEATRRP